MKKHRALSMLLGLSMLFTLGGCGQGETAETSEGASSAAESNDGAEIEVLCNVTTDEHNAVMDQLLEEFTAETGIQVVYSAPGTGYEELMKTRMASNDMPDVFCTHGWAVARYKEYTRPLNDQPWARDVKDSIAAIVTDNDDNLLVLPSNYTTFGVNYNADVLAEAGVNYEDIITWTDFEDACEKIKAIGKIPIAMAGKDSWLAAQPFQVMNPTFLNDEQGAQLADGTFNWDDIIPVLERYMSWVDRGFFNVDSVTCDFNTACQYFGNNEAAFFFCDTSPIIQARTYNPEANLGNMPIPQWESDSSERVAATGEYLSWAVWNGTDKESEALAFLEFLSRPENTKALAEADAASAGLANCEPDLGDLTDDFEILGTFKSVPVWDRTLPSGMFNDMCTIGQGILSHESEDVSEYVTIFRDSYLEKMSS